MQINGIGNQPECGAIFMSNTATKKECLERKLFGLSSLYGNFVKQIKVRMILFLFEYEKRQLHGVFEACSDGRMNIIPDAFRASGRCCPAQVEVRCIWKCKPLFEYEFRGAIEENYFRAKKFNFGLSEHQVSSLLQLFSSKRIGVPRRLTKTCQSSSLIVQSIDEGRQVDDSRTEIHDKIDDEYVPGFINMDMEPISATTAGSPMLDKVKPGHFKYHREDLPSNDGLLRINEGYHGFRIGSAGRTEYSILDKVNLWRSEYSANMDLREAISTQYSRYRSGDMERFPSNGVFLTKDGYEPLVLTDNHSALLPAKVIRLVQSTKPLEIRSFVPEQTITQPSLINHQSDINSYKAPYGDSVVMSTCPSNFDASNLNYPLPLAEEYNVYRYPNKQQSSSHLDPKGASNFPDKISAFEYHTSFSGSASNENKYFGTIAKQVSCGKNWDPGPEKNQRFNNGPSSSESFIRSGTDTCEDVRHFLDTSNSYQAETEDRLQHETAAHTKHWESYEDSLRSQAFLSPYDPQIVHLHEPASSSEYNPEHYQIPVTPFTGGPSKNSRASVFSRLTLPQDACVPEPNAHGDYEDGDATTMVDDVMEMLRNSRQQWVKSKKPKTWKRRQEDAETFVRGKQTVASDEEAPLVLEEKQPGFTFSFTDGTTQSPEVKPLFSFKRRSDAKKLREDGQNALGGAISVNDEGALEEPQKKRKLIRPNFGKSDNDAKSCT